MLCIFLSLLPLAASSALKSLPYGQTGTAVTLFPSPTPSTFDPLLSNDSTGRPALEWSPSSADVGPVRVSHTLKRQARDEDAPEFSDDGEGSFSDESDEDVSEWMDQSGQGGSDGESSDDGSNPNFAKIDQYNSRYSDAELSTFHMDCLSAPEACMNACYWENCVRANAGDTDTPVIYRVGNMVKPIMAASSTSRKPSYYKPTNPRRIFSGAAVTDGTPCRTGPFGQKFWDTYPFNDPPGGNEDILETDEWPMAAFLDFDDYDAKDKNSKNDVPASLRCITKRSNGSGGTQFRAFLNGEGPYAKGKEWHDDRDFPVGPRIPRGAPFKVDFNLDSFDLTNQRHKDIYA
jgi:hypothetical protein